MPPDPEEELLELIHRFPERYPLSMGGLREDDDISPLEAQVFGVEPEEDQWPQDDFGQDPKDHPLRRKK